MKHNKIETLPASENALYEERELEKTHTNFYYEHIIFENIKNGDVEAVQKGFLNYMEAGFVMGNMSDDSLRQMRYWAISGIAVAVHYAILGGADETDAFNLSDTCIRFVDKCKDEEEILNYLGERVVDLTYMVYMSKVGQTDNMAIRRCIHYIHIHLHQKITLEDLANEAYLSKEYLSALFKQETGMTISNYIMNEKLEASLLDLQSGATISKVSYDYNFCSQTHYIEAFKKRYGTTPGKYKKDPGIIS